MDLLTMNELHARYPSIPVATWRFWRHKNIGPPSARIGRRVLYREADVAAWIDAQFAAENPRTAA
jgi:predicted DNA-binding transcriptional regulator AlpA